MNDERGMIEVGAHPFERFNLRHFNSCRNCYLPRGRHPVRGYTRARPLSYQRDGLRLLLVLILIVVGALVLAVRADAHLVARPAGDTRAAIHKSQTTNLAHARYVCREGARAHKRWACRAASGWLLREWKETRPVPAIPHPWYAIALCESSLGTGRPIWNISTGNGFYGGLQFDYGTWHEAQGNLGIERGEPGWTEYAHHATPWQQVRAAMTLPLTRWPHCGAPYR